MPKIIILEGPDGAGKTTLAHSLMKRYPRLNPIVFHEGPPPAHPCLMFYYACKLLEYNRIVENQLVILDRFYLGERVYGPIFRGKDQLGEFGEQQLAALAEKLKVVEFICLPSCNTCIKIWDEHKKHDPEDYVKTRAKLFKVWASYEKLWLRKDDWNNQLRYNWEVEAPGNFDIFDKLLGVIP